MTGLSPRILAAIDEQRYAELPSGIYARASVQAYARAVGVDPTAVLAGLQEQLPQAPLDLLALAELRAPQERDRSHRYLLAAVLDATVLAGLLGAILCVCSPVCGLSPLGLLRSAPLAVAVLWATPAALYFSLLGATDVRTVGPWLLDITILPRSDTPLSLDVWCRRALQYASREVALAVSSLT